MVALTTKKRNKLRKTQFAQPSTESYPINDAAHARNALARASQQLNAGHLTQSQYDSIVTKAKKALKRFNK